MQKTKKKPIKKAADVDEIVPSKLKKEFDLEGHEIFPIDKLDELDSPEEVDESDETVDTVELDEEEINPFKDKWEV